MIAVVSCGALVALGEPVTISLLRRAAELDVPAGGPRTRSRRRTAAGAPIAVGLVLVALLIHSPDHETNLAVRTRGQGDA